MLPRLIKHHLILDEKEDSRVFLKIYLSTFRLAKQSFNLDIETTVLVHFVAIVDLLWCISSHLLFVDAVSSIFWSSFCAHCPQMYWDVLVPTLSCIFFMINTQVLHGFLK